MKNTVFAALALALLSSSALAARESATTHFQITPLVSDQTGQAPNIDPNLVNPWGLSQSPTGPLWVSDEATGLSTVYDRSTGTLSSLVVTIPKGGPTGQVYNSSGGFAVTEGSKTGSSIFLFDSVTGVISGWASSVDSANAVVAIDNSAQGAVYTGLALANDQLFAANIAGNAVEVYDNTFAPVRSFTDPDLPKGFGPFNVAVIKNQVYVAFSHAEDDNDKASRLHMDKGKGKGFVDIFTLDGKLKKRLISGGHLNAPWGLTIAPSSFGSFKGALLVGNFGDGRINAYNAKTGAFIGTLQDSKGKDIQLDGLWALDNGPNDSITFSSGPEDETHGLIGLLTPAKK